MTKEQFIEACEKAGLILNQTQIEQFETYLRLLQEWNEKMNLTSITEATEIWEKHFYDSVMPFKDVKGVSLCDVGTGAGFPGIPVAIAYPDMKVTLVEPLQKRCRFLEAIKSALHLDVTICNQRAEDFAQEHREQFDIVTSRAVARMTILLELCAPLVKVGGTFVALKGKNGLQELRQAKLAMDTLHVSLQSEDHVQVQEAQHIVFYLQKEKTCPKKYPRNYGQIKKKPLGE